MSGSSRSPREHPIRVLLIPPRPRLPTTTSPPSSSSANQLLRFPSRRSSQNTPSETVRKGVRVALRVQIWCIYGGRNRSKRAFGRPVGLRCRPLRDFSDSLSTRLGEYAGRFVGRDTLAT